MTVNAGSEPGATGKFSLRPSRIFKAIVGLAGIAFFLGSNDSVLGWMGLAAGVATILIYRSVRRRHQQRLNAAATKTASGQNFILYLRPFFTSHQLPVYCRLPRLFERWTIGRFWDLELALSLAVEDKNLLVAVGDQSGSLGAAKLTSTEEGWQDLVLRLARQSAAIVAVPFARPGTLWEISQIFADPDLLRKTVLVMPPTTRWQSFWASILPWRRSIRSRWNEAMRALETYEIRLPAYRRKGALLLSNGDTFVTLEACHFHPEYVAEVLNHLMKEGYSIPQASEDNFLRLIERFPRRLPISTWIFFFDPVRTGAWLLLALAIRALLYQPFNIPSQSQYPTLEVGDYVFASKLSYGYGKYSFNFEGQWLPGLPFKLGPLPLDHRLFATSEPKPGDIAVFKLPRDNETNFIDRIVGLPGDRIRMIEGVLHINGIAVAKERVGTYQDFDRMKYGSVDNVPMYRETLPNGVSYVVLDAQANGPGDNTGEYVVPPGHYFMMGDHRDNSLDSRYRQVGFIPYENLVGRADLIYWSIKPQISLWQVWRWPTGIRWGRVLTVIH